MTTVAGSHDHPKFWISSLQNNASQNYTADFNKYHIIISYNTLFNTIKFRNQDLYHYLLINLHSCFQQCLLYVSDTKQTVIRATVIFYLGFPDSKKQQPICNKTLNYFVRHDFTEINTKYCNFNFSNNKKPIYNNIIPLICQLIHASNYSSLLYD